MATSKNPSQVSEFYLACRNGDVDFVKEYLTTLSPINSNPNNLELAVNSTPLHAASHHGHKEIVQLLIEYGCDRSQINGRGLTAYEEAANDEIRQLFKRPTSDYTITRFQDENTEDCFDIVKRPKENTKEKNIPADSGSKPKTKKKALVQGYKTKTQKRIEIGYATTSIAMCQSKLGRLLADKVHQDSPMSLKSIGKRLQQIIEKEIVEKQDPQSQKANELLIKFLNNPDYGNIEHLIRLYTLETKFYHALNQNPMPLALPLYIKLPTLKDRYFQGQSYRGARMDDDDIAAYQWAVKNRGSILQTRHFCSTSIQRSVAEEFASVVNKKSNNTRRNSVLFVFNFPEKCDQTINLSRISDELPCLSEFEDEAEVLILPWTLFQVDSVEEQSSLSYIIYLSNILLPHKSMLASLKWVVKHPKGSMDRFHEHFSENYLPVTVGKQLVENFSNFDKDILDTSNAGRCDSLDPQLNATESSFITFF